ncbi:MAG: DNA-binding NarL/FixJ family response regulator [Paraglaciecola sp.]|jgi:DNA-binding NarL/FixJ family response regulator
MNSIQLVYCLNIFHYYGITIIPSYIKTKVLYLTNLTTLLASLHNQVVEMAKFLIADDHPLFREALIGALMPLFESSEFIQSDTLDSTLEVLSNNQDIDLVLLDLHMPGCENFYGVIRVSEDYPNTPVAVISASDSLEIISHVMSFGAKGFVSKTSPTKHIAEALVSIMAGNSWLPEGIREKIRDVGDEKLSIAQRIAELTPKQFEVFKLLQNGLMNKQIAFGLSITEATVKAHISAIFRKLKVNTRTQAVLLLQKLELI